VLAYAATHKKIRDAEEVEQAEASQQAPTNVTYQHQAMDSALADETATEGPAQGEAQQAIAAAAAARSEAVSRRRSATAAAAAPAQPFVRGSEKVGRNEPCPCGSGKKYKQCHGKLT